MSQDRLRRIVQAVIILFFILQFFGLKAIAGSLTGSVALWYISLIDIFAFLENIAASKDLVLQSVYALIPVLLIYLIVGRAFCGWVCPMDYIFELLSKIRSKFYHREKVKDLDKERLLKKIGYITALFFIVLSALIQTPIFTNYLSHLTNFFRALNSAAFALLSLPFETSILIYSVLAIVLLLILEALYPRLWCRSLCPIGKTYGLFNRTSLLKLAVRRDSCIHCEACDKTCYMDVNISSNTDKSAIRDTNCIFCGRCVEVCCEKGKTLKLTLRR